MRIALPIANGLLNMHFGHCDEFALFEVDPQTKQITKEDTHEAPPHEPGLLPRWLAERGVTLVIAGGMGQRAQSLFASQNIEVIVGAPSEAPGVVVSKYLSGQLATGQNVCDH